MADSPVVRFGVVVAHHLDEAAVQRMRNGVGGSGGSATSYLPAGFVGPAKL
jgi:hypothetical protein